MKFVKSESFNEPLEVDTTSSSKGVYIRQNIVKDVYTDPDTGDTRDVWHYEEAFITKSEYATYQIAKQVVSQVEIKREQEIIDNYTLSLIEEGII